MTPTTYGYDTAYCLKSHYGVRGGVVGRSGRFCLNLYDNSVMKGRVHARRTLKGLVADLRKREKKVGKSFGGKKKVRTFALAIKQ